MSNEESAQPPMPPQRGMVVNYWYSWNWQNEDSQALRNEIELPEADKPRPCMIVSWEKIGDGRDYSVHLAPMTHIPQDDDNAAISLKLDEQKQLYLPERTWIKTDEANFIPRWSQTDCLEKLNGGPLAGQCVYGRVSQERFASVRHSINRNIQHQHFNTVTRRIIEPNSPEFRKGRGYFDD